MKIFMNFLLNSLLMKQQLMEIIYIHLPMMIELNPTIKNLVFLFFIINNEPHYQLNVECLYEYLQESFDTIHMWLMNQLVYVCHHNAKQYQYNDVMHHNLVQFQMIYTNIQDQQHILVYMQIMKRWIKLKYLR